MPIPTESIAEKIKRYRKLKDMSQDELSRLSGINVSTIKKYECGLRNPKPDQLLKIASALGVSVNSFLSYDITSLSDILCLIVKLHKETKTKGIEHIDNISYQYELDGLLLNIEQS
jgi:transcriptional regulator with XRE-family HTH domain